MGATWDGEWYVGDEIMSFPPVPYEVLLSTAIASISIDGDAPDGAALQLEIEASSKTAGQYGSWYTVDGAFDIADGDSATVRTSINTTIPKHTLMRINCDQVGSTTAGGGSGFTGITLGFEEQ
jgi:hypothetical protein